jgi:hypothetical protein
MTARWSDSQARRGECARSPADPKRWQGRWAAGVTGRRTFSLARREPAVWATRLPRIAAVSDRQPHRPLMTDRDDALRSLPGRLIALSVQHGRSRRCPGRRRSRRSPPSSMSTCRVGDTSLRSGPRASSYTATAASISRLSASPWWIDAGTSMEPRSKPQGPSAACPRPRAARIARTLTVAP